MMPESKFSSAKNKIDTDIKNLKNKRDFLHTKLDKLIDKLVNIVQEFEETRKQMEQIPGTIYYENAHPEIFPEKNHSL